MSSFRDRMLAESILEILWPADDPDREWEVDTIEHVARTMKAYGYGPSYRAALRRAPVPMPIPPAPLVLHGLAPDHQQDVLDGLLSGRSVEHPTLGRLIIGRDAGMVGAALTTPRLPSIPEGPLCCPNCDGVELLPLELGSVYWPRARGCGGRVLVDNREGYSYGDDGPYTATHWLWCTHCGGNWLPPEGAEIDYASDELDWQDGDTYLSISSTAPDCAGAES